MTEKNPDWINPEPSPTWDPETEERPVPFRLEHLPAEEDDSLQLDEPNKPDGRGTETASARGYDAERVIQILDQGTRVSISWYDVRSGSDPLFLYESKSCVYEHPCGQPGKFKIWKSNHYDLLGSVADDRDGEGRYFFLIYTVVDDRAYEIGKFTLDPLVIDELVTDWQESDNESMDTPCYQLTWTRLMSVLNISITDLREQEIVRAQTPDWVLFHPDNPP